MCARACERMSLWEQTLSLREDAANDRFLGIKKKLHRHWKVHVHHESCLQLEFSMGVGQGRERLIQNLSRLWGGEKTCKTLKHRFWPIFLSKSFTLVIFVFSLFGNVNKHNQLLYLYAFFQICIWIVRALGE